MPKKDLSFSSTGMRWNAMDDRVRVNTALIKWKMKLYSEIWLKQTIVIELLAFATRDVGTSVIEACFPRRWIYKISTLSWLRFKRLGAAFFFVDWIYTSFSIVERILVFILLVQQLQMDFVLLGLIWICYSLIAGTTWREQDLRGGPHSSPIGRPLPLQWPVSVAAAAVFRRRCRQ